MNNLGPWTGDDFESMSWHDAHIHAFRLETFNPDEGTADLVLDLDFILEWQNAEKESLFAVCRAELRFHEVFGLKFELDYATPSAGMCPLSIDGIKREVEEYSNGHRSFRWHLPINWPRGSIAFTAPGFTQTLMGEPVTQSHQVLAPEQRRRS